MFLIIYDIENIIGDIFTRHYAKQCINYMDFILKLNLMT